MSWISLVYLNLRKNLIEQLPVVVVKNWSKVSFDIYIYNYFIFQFLFLKF